MNWSLAASAIFFWAAFLGLLLETLDVAVGHVKGGVAGEILGNKDDV